MIGSCVKHDNFLIDKSYLEGILVNPKHHTVKLEFLLIIMQSDISFYNSRQPMLTFISDRIHILNFNSRLFTSIGTQLISLSIQLNDLMGCQNQVHHREGKCEVLLDCVHLVFHKSARHID